MNRARRLGSAIAATQLLPGVTLTLWQAGDGWRFGGWRVAPMLVQQGQRATLYPLRKLSVAQQRRRFTTVDQAADFYREVLEQSHRVSDATSLASGRR